MVDKKFEYIESDEKYKERVKLRVNLHKAEMMAGLFGVVMGFVLMFAFVSKNPSTTSLLLPVPIVIFGIYVISTSFLKTRNPKYLPKRFEVTKDYFTPKKVELPKKVFYKDVKKVTKEVTPEKTEFKFDTYDGETYYVPFYFKSEIMDILEYQVKLNLPEMKEIINYANTTYIYSRGNN